MADIEEAAGAEGAVREWLARAARAPRDRAWVAGGVISDRWAPVSPSGALDAFVWRTPEERLSAPEPPAQRRRRRPRLPPSSPRRLPKPAEPPAPPPAPEIAAAAEIPRPSSPRGRNPGHAEAGAAARRRNDRPACRRARPTIPVRTKRASASPDFGCLRANDRRGPSAGSLAPAFLAARHLANSGRPRYETADRRRRARHDSPPRAPQ